MGDSKGVNGNVKFVTTDGTFTVDIGSIKNAIAFERHFDTPATILTMRPRLEHIAFMAYAAAKDSGISVPDDFDAFVDELQDIEVIDAEGTEAPGPTGGGQSPEL